jgi:hypothetical protein
MAQVWQRKLGHPEQSILLALADHAEDDGTNVYPSVGYTAWKTGYSGRQVRRILGAMRERGVLVVVQDATQHRPTEYRIVLDSVPVKAAFNASLGEPQVPRIREDKMSALHSQPGQAVSAEAAQPGHPDRPELRVADTPDLTSVTARADIAMSPEPSGTNSDASSSASAEDDAASYSTRTSATQQGEADEREVTGLKPELRAFVEPVRKRLADVAAERPGAIAPTSAAVARLLARFPRKDFIPLADDFAHWSLHGRGRGRKVRDVVQTYRNWIAKEPDVLRPTPVPGANETPGRRSQEQELAELKRRLAEADR